MKADVHVPTWKEKTEIMNRLEVSSAVTGQSVLRVATACSTQKD